MRHRLPADVLLLTTVLFWSFNFTVVKYALTHGWEPLAYSSIRFAIGAVIFSAFTYGREHTLRVARGDVLRRVNDGDLFFRPVTSGDFSTRDR